MDADWWVADARQNNHFGVGRCPNRLLRVGLGNLGLVYGMLHDTSEVQAMYIVAGPVITADTWLKMAAPIAKSRVMVDCRSI